MKPGRLPLTIPAKSIKESGFHLEVHVAPPELEVDDDFYRFAGDIHVDAQAVAAGREFLVKGAIRAHAVAECARCLAPVTLDLCLKDWAFLYPDTGQDFIDIASEVRDELLLALPQRVLCEKEDPDQMAEYRVTSVKSRPPANPFQQLEGDRGDE